MSTGLDNKVDLARDMSPLHETETDIQCVKSGFTFANMDTKLAWYICLNEVPQNYHHGMQQCATVEQN